jgi:hypothetical protein
MGPSTDSESTWATVSDARTKGLARRPPRGSGQPQTPGVAARPPNGQGVAAQPPPSVRGWPRKAWGGHRATPRWI